MFKHGRISIVRNASSAGIISKAQVVHVIVKGLGGGPADVETLQRQRQEICNRAALEISGMQKFIARMWS
jgi:hypothetical protein